MITAKTFAIKFVPVMWVPQLITIMTITRNTILIVVVN